MADPRTPTPQDAARRKGVVRTAWVIGGIALAVYVLFLLSGVLGQ